MSQFSTDQLNSLIESALNSLKKERDREVLLRRGGINIDKSQTLEQIGQDLNITRERVRQIEKAALTKIRETHDHNHDFANTSLELIGNTGGIMSVQSLLDALELDDSNKPQAVFLLKSHPAIVFVDRNDHHAQVVLLAEQYDAAQLKELHEALIEAVKKQAKPAKFSAIAKRIDGPHNPEALEEIARASAYLSQLDKLWGLTSWPEVNPKSIRDKIYLVLKKAGRPMHFTEIAEKISSLKANPKKVTTQAVHNELIKDKRFVLIGRGIYALSEWGYRSGTVADIIEEVLKEESPLSKDEIIKRVLARRQVKTTTIVLNLQEKPQFVRVDKGVYSLAK